MNNTTEEIWVHDINEITFTDVAFTCGTSTITYGGITYNTVEIGTQCWFKENLNVGIMIPGTDPQIDNSTIEKYCYNNVQDSCDYYGGLYQWDEAMQYVDTAGAQGICPDGWHIPTFEEFQTLGTFVNNDGNALATPGHWPYFFPGTNTSGFSGLLTGYYDSNYGWFNGCFYETEFWSSLEHEVYQNGAVQMRLFYDFGNAIYVHLYPSNPWAKTWGLCVRCIMD